MFNIHNNLPEAPAFKAHGFQHIGTAGDEDMQILVWQDLQAPVGIQTYAVVTTAKGEDLMLWPSGYVSRFCGGGHQQDVERRLAAAITDMTASGSW